MSFWERTTERALQILWRLRFRDILYRSTIRRTLRRARRSQLEGLRTVRLLGNFSGLWQRTIAQTPGGSCQWGDTLFVAEGEADLYIVLNSVLHPHGWLPKDFTFPKAGHVWGLHMEPEEYVRMLHYDDPDEHRHISRFYTNCNHLISRGGRYAAAPPYVHFQVGKSWDFLKTAAPPDKTITLGVICSNLVDLEGHRARLNFLHNLNQSGIDYALWGRGEGLERFKGYRGFALSKWMAHSQCKYSIVLENTVSDWYWSEKVADALLSFSLPLYHGCPRIGSFLPPESVIPIDIHNPGCIEEIADVIRSGAFEKRFSAIAEARRLILHEQNLYAFIDREAKAHFQRGGAPQEIE